MLLLKSPDISLKISPLNYLGSEKKMMKYLKILICLFAFFCQFLLAVFSLTLMADENVKQEFKEKQGKNNKIEYITNLAKAYRKARKFEKAQKLLHEALDRIPHKENQKKLQIELADVHFWWAEHLRIKNNYSNAVKHYEMAYLIDKFYRPHNAAIELNNIGSLYIGFGKQKKALEYLKKSLIIRQSVVDRKEEAKTLNNIGTVYYTLDHWPKALEYYKKALYISEKVGFLSGEADTLNNIGIIYSDRGEIKKALEYYEKALSRWRAVEERSKEAIALSNIGILYYELGLKLKALEYYEKALAICKTVEDKKGEARAINSIAGLYSELGEKQKALEYYKKALSIWQDVGDRNGAAHTINNIGATYSDLGQNQKALEYYEQSLHIRQAMRDIDGEALTLTNIGLVYSDLGLNQKAMEYHEKALQIFQELGNRAREAATINNIGGLYSELRQKQKAMEYFNKALLIFQELGDRVREATTLNNLASLYDTLGQKQKALEYLEKALPIKQAAGDRTEEALILSNLMFQWNKLKNPQLSIYYGKQSVNIYQKIRSNISGLDKKIKQSYLESKKNTYRRLANLLIVGGRLSEAQQVLDMQKEQEYFDFIRRDASSGDVLSIQVDYTEFEKQWLEKYNTLKKNFSTISNEFHLLKFRRIKNETELKRMEELELKLKEAQKAYKTFLVQLNEACAKLQRKMKDKADTTALAKKANELQSTLRYLDEKEDGKNVALHYLVYKGRISVILTTTSSQSAKQTQIFEKEFNLMIINYRNLIMQLGKLKRGVELVKNPDDTLEVFFQKKKEYEKKLYNAIFKPVDEELKKYGATNLTISLDGVLRYIPLAALWDGKSYLVQRFRIALITPSSLKNIKDIPTKEKRILGLGASRGGQGFAPLPYVRREIRSIVKDEKKGYDGLIKGKAFIDNDFTKDTMVNQLKNKAYPLVHISSHFKFSPGDETKNHLLLGDGTIMKLSDIRRMGKLFDNVKLLVLSACQTGVGGNGEEIDGFGELAQQSGATSVIASLWPVADESTKDLMVNFYRIMKEGKVTSKIEALRQAQLELAGLKDLLSKNKGQTARRKTKYSHPYYWGPFILIGNWR
jgi:CHAT domain-containing protein/tetratricopeptide (TPR) repeat protein